MRTDRRTDRRFSALYNRRIVQINVSDSSTMKIVYNTCIPSWVLLCIFKKNYYTMPRIAKQKDRTVIYKSRRGTHASCYAFKRLAKY